MRNLIILAAVDGHDDPVEYDYIRDVMKREQMNETDFEYCSTNSAAIDYVVPETFGERLEYLHDMIQLMMLDGDCDDREMELCRECAEMMNIPSRSGENLVDSMVSLIADEFRASGRLLTYNQRQN